MIALLALATMLTIAEASSQPSSHVQPSAAKKDAATQNKPDSIPPINITVTTPDKSTTEKEAERKREERIDLTNERIAEANIQIAWLTRLLVWVGAAEAAGTILAFIVGIRAANAAKSGAEIAAATLRVSHRAYLDIDKIQFLNFGPGHTPDVIVQVRNSGRMPATVTGWAIEMLTEQDFPPMPPPYKKWMSRSFVVFPNQVGTIRNSGTGMPPFTSDQWTAIENGKFSINIYGGARYDAGFDIVGEVGFGSHFDPKATHIPEFHRRFASTDITGYNYAR